MRKKIIPSVFLFFSILSLYAQNNFKFIFMADVHYQEKRVASEAFDAAIDTINKLNPDFILVGGDMVYDALRRPLVEAKKQSLSFLKKIEKLKSPVFYTIGNHDHFALYNKNVETNHPLFGKLFYEHYFGSRYYSFDHKGWHFISIDDMIVTEDRKYIGMVDSIQLEWLKNDLKQIDDSTPVVIMTHVPLITTLSQWYGGGTKANDNKVAIENSDEVLRLFKNKNLRLVLQGHIHYYEVLHILNKTTVISAPSFSGKWWSGQMHGLNEGFVQIEVFENGNINYQLIDYNWKNRKCN